MRQGQVSGTTIVHSYGQVFNSPACRPYRLPVLLVVRRAQRQAAQQASVAKDIKSRAVGVLGPDRGPDRGCALVSEGLSRDIVGRGVVSEKVTLVPNAISTGEFSQPLRWSDALRLGFRRWRFRWLDGWWLDGWWLDGRC